VIAARLLALYDAEMRADPPPDPDVRIERDTAVVREVGEQDCVLFSDFSGTDPGTVIAREAARARGADAELLWKVYGHDRPTDLGDLLGAAGFVRGEPETLMAFDLETGLPRAQYAEGVEARRVADAADLAAWGEVSGESFGRDDRGRMQRYASRLQDETVALFVAWAHGRPVAAARLELAPGRSIATLWGGGTVPAYRGRGMYRLLVAARAREARRRGYRYAMVEARDTSRPILERTGFVPLTSITEWTLHARP
jgi:GNAT superfamily N-acetyltransferase